MYMENPKESTDEFLELINLARLLDTEPTCKIPLLLYIPATELKYLPQSKKIRNKSHKMYSESFCRLYNTLLRESKEYINGTMYHIPKLKDSIL